MTDVLANFGLTMADVQSIAAKRAIWSAEARVEIRAIARNTSLDLARQFVLGASLASLIDQVVS